TCGRLWGAAFLPENAKAAAAEYGGLSVGKLAQEAELVFCPWLGFPLHAFRLPSLRRLRSNFACEIGMSKRGLWAKLSQRMLSIKFPLRHHHVADEPPV